MKQIEIQERLRCFYTEVMTDGAEIGYTHMECLSCGANMEPAVDKDLMVGWSCSNSDCDYATPSLNSPLDLAYTWGIRAGTIEACRILRASAPR